MTRTNQRRVGGQVGVSRRSKVVNLVESSRDKLVSEFLKKEKFGGLSQVRVRLVAGDVTSWYQSDGFSSRSSWYA